ncbi:protein FAR1-RELATED SEQUENCE 11-like [Apium graveolens]|uniref:protein FAR1-RELATED SEQUENCE 11-like n=1 Tax=Apium graveolens TaxID=4045 RepID=UPI003D79D3C6
MKRNNIDLNKFFEEAIEDEEQEASEEEEQENKNISFEPFIGQCFQSEEEACLFYHKYAKQYGFSIRKARFDKNKDGEIKRRDFVCHREGLQLSKMVDPVLKQRNTPSTRCACKAHMRVTLKKSFEIFSEQWHVTEFIVTHNHELFSQEKVRFLRSYRFMTKDDEKRILLLKDGGLSVKQIMCVMELEKNVRHGHLSFTSKDIHNFFSKIRSEQAKNDVLDFFEYYKIAKEENQYFQYSVTLNGEIKVEHIFWSSAHCFTWYQSFGDVMIFDTTYKINAYDMSLGMFVGIDNHGRTILFGCALLRNETKSIFSWLMRVHLAIEDIGQNQLQARMLEKYKGGSLRTLSPPKEQAQKVLTPFSFKKIQEQFERATHYTVHTNSVGGFVVHHYVQGDTQKHEVMENG